MKYLDIVIYAYSFIEFHEVVSEFTQLFQLSILNTLNLI